MFNPTMPATGPARGYTRTWFVPADVMSFLLHAVIGENESDGYNIAETDSMRHDKMHIFKNEDP